MLKKLFIWFLAIFSLTAGQAANQQHFPTTIHIATEEYPPYTSSQLPHNGIAAHIITEAFALEGIKVVYEFLPGARSYKKATSGNADGTLPWVYRKEREAAFYYGEPVLEAGVDGFFHLKDFNFSWDSKNIDYAKISNLRVGGVLGYNYGKAFQEAEKSGLIEVSRVESVEQGFKMLLKGHLQLFFLEDKPGYYQLFSQFSKDNANKITHTKEEERVTMYTYLLLSKQAKYPEYFLSKMNKGIKKLHENGHYSKIMNDLHNGEYTIKQK